MTKRVVLAPGRIATASLVLENTGYVLELEQHFASYDQNTVALVEAEVRRLRTVIDAWFPLSEDELRVERDWLCEQFGLPENHDCSAETEVIYECICRGTGEIGRVGDVFVRCTKCNPKETP